ncbi:hypothetical protein [Mucilaginibacter dorajii]|uniref:DUF3108 domain-containing protein n=1 Tax=Mucilaginibacter dorajii TaxID=692994 RepID=A0ABP7PI39_9SPHI|nr:hypothetical protein [Mucilaginibacter dorajii]MCS3733380.1 hypothetical protein [Mucilaginibacter dorajii]
MRKISLIILLLVICSQFVSAQNCSQFINSINGKKFRYANQNTQGNTIGTMVCNTTKKDASTIAAHIELFDKTSKSMGSGDSEILCTGTSIKVDMKTFIPASSLKQLGSMQMTGDTKYLTYPMNLKAGQKLEDGALTINVANNGQQMGQVLLNINNRKVEKAEKISTKAGSFDCFKITNDVSLNIKMMGMSLPFQIKIIEWFAPKLGRFAKSETYGKDGKLVATTMLEAIN